MYVLRQMAEKRLEVQGSMTLGFVDIEKAFDTVPRNMVMAVMLLTSLQQSCHMLTIECKTSSVIQNTG